MVRRLFRCYLLQCTLETGRKLPMFWETWTGTGETDRKTSSILGDLDPDDIMRTLVGLGWLELM